MPLADSGHSTISHAMSLLDREKHISFPDHRGAGALMAGPDAELIALCGRYLAHRAEVDCLYELQCAAEEAGDTAAADPYFEQQRGMVPALHAMEDEMASLPAHTPEGLRLKAKALTSRICYEIDGSVCREDQLLHTLCRDILAGGAA